MQLDQRDCECRRKIVFLLTRIVEDFTTPQMKKSRCSKLVVGRVIVQDPETLQELCELRLLRCFYR